MLKVIVRIFLILIVIAMVSAALYVLVQNTSLGLSFGRGDFGSRSFTGQPPAAPISGTLTGIGFSPGRFGEGGEGRFSFSLLRGLSGVLGNTIAIGAITLMVVLVRKPRAPRLLRVRPVSLDQP
jgi:hypothetical protein